MMSLEELRMEHVSSKETKSGGRQYFSRFGR